MVRLCILGRLRLAPWLGAASALPFSLLCGALWARRRLSPARRPGRPRRWWRAAWGRRTSRRRWWRRWRAACGGPTARRRRWGRAARRGRTCRRVIQTVAAGCQPSHGLGHAGIAGHDGGAGSRGLASGDGQILRAARSLGANQRPFVFGAVRSWLSSRPGGRGFSILASWLDARLLRRGQLERRFRGIAALGEPGEPFGGNDEPAGRARDAGAGPLAFGRGWGIGEPADGVFELLETFGGAFDLSIADPILRSSGPEHRNPVRVCGYSRGRQHQRFSRFRGAARLRRQPQHRIEFIHGKPELAGHLAGRRSEHERGRSGHERRVPRRRTPVMRGVPSAPAPPIQGAGG